MRMRESGKGESGVNRVEIRLRMRSSWSEREGVRVRATLCGRESKMERENERQWEGGSG